MSGKSFSQLVVVGSSAGGIEALSRLVSTLPIDVEDHRLAEEALARIETSIPLGTNQRGNQSTSEATNQ